MIGEQAMGYGAGLRAGADLQLCAALVGGALHEAAGAGRLARQPRIPARRACAISRPCASRRPAARRRGGGRGNARDRRARRRRRRPGLAWPGLAWPGGWAARTCISRSAISPRRSYRMMSEPTQHQVERARIQ
ncbi:hypothetical protein RD23_04820 [Bordetella pertussis]|nr:hypothetical protein RD23_04820 [Bordetella pertussis]